MSQRPTLAAIVAQASGAVRPTSRISDGLIAELVRRALIAEPTFFHCWVHLQLKGKRELGTEPVTVNGEIAIRVVDGAVMLDGEVACLGQKRLAGALAWWVPGSRTIINALRVSPPVEDNDAGIADAVRWMLKKDPFVRTDQVRVTTDHATVTLDGVVPTKLAREIAEHDAWYVYGVEEVVNRIEVG
jgi:osmotically-inducible protein OsmY